MRAATHGCNEGSIEAGWLGQSHLPVMLNYVPTIAFTLALAVDMGCVWVWRADHDVALFTRPFPALSRSGNPTRGGHSTVYAGLI